MFGLVKKKKNTTPAECNGREGRRFQTLSTSVYCLFSAHTTYKLPEQDLPERLENGPLLQRKILQNYTPPPQRVLWLARSSTVPTPPAVSAYHHNTRGNASHHGGGRKLPHVNVSCIATSVYIFRPRRPQTLTHGTPFSLYCLSRRRRAGSSYPPRRRLLHMRAAAVVDACPTTSPPATLPGAALGWHRPTRLLRRLAGGEGPPGRLDLPSGGGW